MKVFTQFLLIYMSFSISIAHNSYLFKSLMSFASNGKSNNSVLSNHTDSTMSIFEQVQSMVVDLSKGLDESYLNSTTVVQAIISGCYDGITDIELNSLAAETAAYMSAEHPDYGRLAARIAVKQLHRLAPAKFSEAIELLYNQKDPFTGINMTNLSPLLVDRVRRYAAILDETINISRDFDFDYFGIRTLEKSYLMKMDGKPVETPQYMFMRVALGIHLTDGTLPASPSNRSNEHTLDINRYYDGTTCEGHHNKVDGEHQVEKCILERPDEKQKREQRELEAALETYKLLSEKWFIHASPTLFQAGTAQPQLSSCFLLGVESDSIEGIYRTLHRCALISKAAGGIGLSVQNIRAKGSPIRGTKGVSNGLVPMLRVFDATARYVDQGGGKRPGAFAIYIEPWHGDVFEVLELRKNTGKEEGRARDLFYGLWVPDLFMRRVHADADWSLMCPSQCPGLDDAWGEKFDSLYEQYEKEGRALRVVKARELWFRILDAQMETGTPYILFKDACNAKSNQQNLGTIRCSNLCTEIIEFSAPDEVAVCNLASLCLPKYVIRDKADSDYKAPNGSMNAAYYGLSDDDNDGSGSIRVFDHDKLRLVVGAVTRNLNRVIDINYYPIPEAKRSNLRHRPIGIGVQGLADALQLMRLPFDCSEARRLNVDIFETIYFAALEASCELAEQDGPYTTYHGSPASKGLLQFDLWELHPPPGQDTAIANVQDSSGTSTTTSILSHTQTAVDPNCDLHQLLIHPRRWDWDGLKKRIAKHGLRNSLLLAPMPTASTAQILGANECFEPYTSNLYARRVKAGEFIVVNPHLLKDLVKRGLWTKQIRNEIIAAGGSVQGIKSLSAELKTLYRTVWELRQRSLVDMAAERGPYIDQSQSLNVFMPQPDYAKLTSLHFHSWRRGLKTGMYYLRTKPAAQAIQFTVEKPSLNFFPRNGQEGYGSDYDDGSESHTTSSEIEEIYGPVCDSCSG